MRSANVLINHLRKSSSSILPKYCFRSIPASASLIAVLSYCFPVSACSISLTSFAPKSPRNFAVLNDSFFHFKAQINRPDRITFGMLKIKCRRPAEIPVPVLIALFRNLPDHFPVFIGQLIFRHFGKIICIKNMVKQVFLNSSAVILSSRNSLMLATRLLIDLMPFDSILSFSLSALIQHGQWRNPALMFRG